MASHSASVAKSWTTKTGGVSRSTSTLSLRGAVRLAMMALLAAPHSCAVFDLTHECHPSAALAPTPEVLKWIVCLSCLRSAGAAGVE
eukprot:scaffold33420_cov68-Phaeocystis_antarctica.AAC.5